MKQAVVLFVLHLVIVFFIWPEDTTGVYQDIHATWKGLSSLLGISAGPTHKS